jgi:hypothetical protein
MSKIPVASETFGSVNILTVTVGTNCPAQGDGAQEGRTLLRLRNDEATNISVRVNGGRLQGQVESIEIVLGGDAECETFIQALEFALKVLRAQTEAKSVAGRFEELD